MDATILGIFIGFFLTGMLAGIPIGQAFEHRRLIERRASRRKDLTFGEMKTPAVLSQEEIEDVLSAREIS